MSYLVQEDFVRYECTCGSLSPIPKLYFCRHCLKLRCGYCVCHEVDSHYCSNCMEHLPSAEAKMKKNRCVMCFDCPNCFHTLSIRATTRAPEDGSNKGHLKHYYLSCFFCRWTTRDVGIPDQIASSGNWPLKENPHQELLSSFLEHYKVVAMRERSQKDKKPIFPRRGYSTYTEKFGLTNLIARKRAGLPSLPLPGKEVNPASIPPIKPCVATDVIDTLPASYFTDVPDLTKITTIAQRHANPMIQATVASELHPQHRHFFIKRSLRCRSCEHNVSKPEYNPASIKFKIQQAAYYHVPEIRIKTFEPLRAGKPSEIILKVTNPTSHVTSLSFSPKSEVNKGGVSDSVILDSLGAPKKTVEIPRPVVQDEPNTQVELPTEPIVLPARDDAAEYDDSGDTHNFHDDANVVVWRKGNKAAVKFRIVPDRGMKPGDRSIFSFSMEYGYVNTMPTTAEQKSPQRAEMQVNVLIAPGLIVGNLD
ncbi:Dynactin p62 family [Nesidiocoris tenuis]|uniref:Dynactin subunit 4 n=1 Tax=Nesidiocoris tenuis TaxID=355587 RepID=A0ABN7B6Y0_9HEMI|nr:Dynactin p62 family [Nesidiocoris tenuis]